MIMVGALELLGLETGEMLVFPHGGCGGYKSEFSDPPSWPGWSYRRQWVTSVRRWNKQTDIPVFRRAEKVLRTLGWELQVDFEHLTEAQLASEHYLEYILQIIEMKAGVRDDDERRQACRNVMHEVGRRRDETLAQFAMRRVRDFTRAASFGVQLPNEFKAAMLREGLGLSEQGLQNLTALMQGRIMTSTCLPPRLPGWAPGPTRFRLLPITVMRPRPPTWPSSVPEPRTLQTLTRRCPRKCWRTRAYWRSSRR